MLATVWSACNRCNENNIACVNETHFQYCIDSKPFVEGGTLPCEEGKVCTALGIFCASADLGFKPDCPASDIDCRPCNEDQLFQCTSKTTFRMCRGNEFTGETIPCPKDTVCSMDSGKFCVKECELTDGKYECNKDAP